MVACSLHRFIHFTVILAPVESRQRLQENLPVFRRIVESGRSASVPRFRRSWREAPQPCPQTRARCPQTLGKLYVESLTFSTDDTSKEAGTAETVASSESYSTLVVGIIISLIVGVILIVIIIIVYRKCFVNAKGN